jgi:hypothetical protein
MNVDLAKEPHQEFREWVVDRQVSLYVVGLWHYRTGDRPGLHRRFLTIMEADHLAIKNLHAVVWRW